MATTDVVSSHRETWRVKSKPCSECIKGSYENCKCDNVWNVLSKPCSACLDGKYQDCHCNSVEKRYPLQRELSSDSLDDGSNTYKYKQERGNFCRSNNFVSDIEFEDRYTQEHRPLPPSTTDWDSIDSVLENELEVNENDVKIPLSSRLSYGVNLQMVFVESEDSDKESDPDVEVYYDDNFEFYERISGSRGNLSCEYDRNIDSRDSGYVPGDLLDLNIEKVTDKRRHSLEPVEASTRVLESLKIHEEHERRKYIEAKEKEQKEHDAMSEVHRKNVDELKAMKDTLEARIAQINLELVQELMARDELHSHHEALLMDADDLSRTHNEQKTPTKKSVSTDDVTSPKNKSRFWRR